MSEETNRIEMLRTLLGVPEGSASFLDDAAFYFLDQARSYQLVVARLHFSKPRLKDRGFYLVTLNEGATHQSFVVHIASEGQPLIIGNLVVYATKDGTSIDGIEDGGHDPYYNNIWFGDFWRDLTTYTQPPSYDEVIKFWHRSRARNPKTTLKETCERMGANYASVRVQKSQRKQ